MNRNLEQALIELAWTDPDFGQLLAEDPHAALKHIGVTVPDGIRLDIRVQRPNTLYYVIPPEIDDGADADVVINQMDLWRSGDQFVWIMPQHKKVDLLKMRQQHRQWSRNAEERTQ